MSEDPFAKRLRETFPNEEAMKVIEKVCKDWKTVDSLKDHWPCTDSREHCDSNFERGSRCRP